MKQNAFKYRVAGVLLDGQRVLIHKCQRESYWSLPGGKIEFGETSAEALEREIQEETGFRVQTGRLLWISENIYHQQDRMVHEIAFYYQVHLPEDVPQQILTGCFTGIEPGKALFFQWWDLYNLASIDLYPQFLKEKLNHLPEGVEHLVFRETGGG